MLLTHMPNFPLYELSSMVFFFVPILVIVILYAKMGIQIRNSYKLTKKKNLTLFQKETQHMRTRKGVIKMLSEYFN
jgi:neuromedin U receptor 1